MNAFTTCLLLATITKIGYCQTTYNQPFLEGSWQYVYHYATPDTNELSFEKHYLTEYQFDRSGTYKLNYYNLTTINHDTCFRGSATGFYKLSKRGDLKIKEYPEGFVPNHNGLHNLIGKMSARTIYLNDVIVGRDSMVEQYYDKYSDFTYFKKLNQPIQVTQNGLDSCAYKNFFQEVIILPPQKHPINKDLFLINALDTNKRVYVPEFTYIEFSHDILQPDSNYNHKFIWGTGVIDTLRHDSLDVEMDFIKTTMLNDCTYERLITTSEIQTEEDKFFAATFDLHNKTTFVIESPTSMAMQGISNFGMLAGGVTAAIIAPLISINYKSGEFNEKKYYRVAGYSLSVAIICIPIHFVFAPKSYSIIPTGTQPAKNKWYLSY